MPKNLRIVQYLIIHPAAHSLTLLSKPLFGDFLGGPVVNNLLSNAVDSGSTLGQGTKIPHAMGQISLNATTREKPTHCNERSRMPQQRSQDPVYCT